MRGKILKSRVDAAEPGTFLWDSEVKGFGLKVTPAGRRLYVLQFRMGGRGSRTKRINIGEHGADNLTADRARSEAIRLRGLIRSGTDPAAERRKGREAPTLDAFAERYLTDHARPRKKPRSIAEDERNLRLHILPALGQRKLSELGRSDIARFHTALKATPTNANRCLALLSHIMAKAEEWGVHTSNSNPCRHVEKFEERKRQRFLSPDEMALLGDALTGAEHDKTEPASAIAAIRLLCVTGCRLSEILTLKWSYVDWDRARLNLPDSKTGEKSVPLGATAMSLLTEIEATRTSEWVCPAARGDGHFAGIQRPWQRIRAAAGLHGVRLHDLRHSFASVAISGGDSLFIVGKVLGHSQARTTERYSHLHDDVSRQVADRASSKIDAAMRLDPEQRKVVRLTRK